jgi:glycosyltransferase involved in cell wall biosynthesis
MKNLQNILFYIVVPVFKAELFIEKCIDSVIGQTYPNWQLILIDDGSPDKSGEICDNMSKNNEKIHVIHQENKGQIAARMAGIRHISDHKEPDSFVCFLDSDDTYEPHTLQTIRENIEKDGSDMVIFNWQRINNNGKIIREKNIHNGIVTDKGELYKIVLSDPAYNSLCLKAISTDLVENIDYSSLYHIRHGEDLIQSLHYYRFCKKVTFIDKVLYNYTINESSVTQCRNASRYRFNSEVRSIVWDFLQKENVWNDNEMQDYAIRMQKLLEGIIRKISKFNIPFKRKLEIFKTIESDEYCKKIFSYPVKSFILKLFLARKYRTLLFFVGIRNWISGVLNRLK